MTYKYIILLFLFYPFFHFLYFFISFFVSFFIYIRLPSFIHFSISLTYYLPLIHWFSCFFFISLTFLYLRFLLFFTAIFHLLPASVIYYSSLTFPFISHFSQFTQTWLIGQQPITIFLSSSLHSPETFLPLFSCLISFHFDLLPCYISSPLLFPPLLSSLLSGPAVMSIEAGGINGWWKYAHAPFGMETFGYVHIFILTHVHTNTASHSLTLSLSLTHSLTHSLSFYLFISFCSLILSCLISIVCPPQPPAFIIYSASRSLTYA